MKHGFVKVASATPHVQVADCEYNVKACIDIARNAADRGVKVLVFPELAITGYTCGDLFYQGTLISAAKTALSEYIAETADLDMMSVIGLPVCVGDKLYNCAAAVCGGSLLGLVPKSHIPNHNAHSEGRWFTPAPEDNIAYELDGAFVMLGTKQLFVNTDMPSLCVGVEVCEDFWISTPPSAAAAGAGATLICNLSASFELVGKEAKRRALVLGQSAVIHGGYIYSSCGDDESTTDLVFSGHDMIAECGEMLAERRPFDNANCVVCEGGSYIFSEIDIEKISYERRRQNTYTTPYLGEYHEAYFTLGNSTTELTRRISAHPFIPDEKEKVDAACERILTIQAQGLKTRIKRAYAKKIIIGISGGLDSSLALLVMARAMDILGRDRKDIIAVTMPCFGTTKRTKNNATVLCESLGVDFRCVDIYDAVKVHFRDIGHAEDNYNVVYENAQARERTQVLMDIANAEGGMVIGTGDLSELALGWATYNGDHMSMYSVNGGVPKTLVRHIVSWYAENAEGKGEGELAAALRDVLDTPVSPELLPADKKGDIAQKTEDLVGPYELHDFFLYHLIRRGASPAKIYRLARYAFGDKYDGETVYKWLSVFMKRFFNQQFKRSCLPDGPKVGSVGVSPRGDLSMPSDASYAVWKRELDELATIEGFKI
ncbi:MAG: NAD(+) synthase [Ruminococcaceae bacterium]|nr:NAD(+) synthase [Oscillospiraceae bacterium]